MSVLRWVGRVYHGLLTFMGLLPGILFGLVAVLLAADVLIRNASMFGIRARGFVWAIEVTEYALLASAMLGAAFLLRADRHVAVDLFTAGLPTRARKVVDLIARTAVLAVSATVTWFAVVAMLRARSDGTILFKMITIPEWPLLALVAFGFGLTTIEAARQWVLALMGRDPHAGFGGHDAADRPGV